MEHKIGFLSKFFYQFPLSVRIALRELRGGLRGFYIFVACMSLGVTAIIAVNAISDMLQDGIAKQGQVLLGGDISLSRIHQSANEETKIQLAKYGNISEVATMRAMARKIDGSAQALVEIKAVDNAYPMFGELTLKDSKNFSFNQPLIAYADSILFERLGLKVGDLFRLGSKTFKLAGVIVHEPDRLSSRNAFGPRLLLSLNSLKASGLAQDGSLVRWRYRIKLNQRYDNLIDTNLLLKEKFSKKGFFIRDRRNPAPGIKEGIERLGKFLTLVGLTALLIGGVGIANAVISFIDQKRPTIATLKSLGAKNRIVFWVYLTQILIIASLGIFFGLVIGFFVPAIISFLFSDVLPVQLNFFPKLRTVFLGVAYGLSVALLFVLLPLRLTRNIRPQMLFRNQDFNLRQYIGFNDYLIIFFFVILIAGLAVFSSQAELFALYFCGALIVLFILFLLYGRFVEWLTKKLPRLSGASMVIARANITGPNSLTRSIILSLGLGLSLLVAIANIDNSLVLQLQAGLPKTAPSHFFLDIKKDQFSEFKNQVMKDIPQADLSFAPMLRGRIVKLSGLDANKIKAPKNFEWILRGDRGISYSEILPNGSNIIEGFWWGRNYEGPPLVSFEVEAARAFGLKIGDEIVVNVLGREIVAKVANLRTVKWESLSINFVMVFSPNTLSGAPVNMLATLKTHQEIPIKAEAELLQKLSLKFPNITAIRVRDAIEAVGSIYEKIMLAIRSAGGLTLIAGALVLSGSLISAQRQRIYDSVIFKTIGATRWQIISAHMIEYFSLALFTGIMSLLLGSFCAWVVLTYLFELKFSLSLISSFQVMMLSIIIVIVFGVFGTWRVLTAKSVPYLRDN